MYEVQKAFEDQKEEFRKKEENFKKRESELREKDILIQDHLIKFSTFLQSHDMRRKKDMQLHEIEEEKIKEKEKESLRGKEIKASLNQKAKDIERKVERMQKFEAFLERVKEQHPDEFQELNDILSRYYTLQKANKKLSEAQEDLTKKLDNLQHQITEQTQKAITQKIKLNNDISQKQQDLEKLEDFKGRMMAENQEVTSKKLKKTTEHGQILMAIDNLYVKCMKRKELITSKEYIVSEERNFDSVKSAGATALSQLLLIRQSLQNFNRLSNALKDKPEIVQGVNLKKENYEIV